MFDTIDGINLLKNVARVIFIFMHLFQSNTPYNPTQR
jgi:hypothetical protein